MRAGGPLLLTALLSLGSATCAREQSTRTAAAEADIVEQVAPPPAAPADQDELDASLADRVPLWLPNFYASLQQLASGQRQRHVRVLWFGDSHTAADFWTDAVRQPLQGRFGAGGAGLVLLGLKRYRHGLAKLSRSGDWRVIPRSPAATQPHPEGFLGLAGVGAVPTSADASARIELNGALGWAQGKLRWELLYRLPKATSSFGVRSGEAPQHTVRAGQGQLRPSGLASLVLESQSHPFLTLDDFVDEPELFGVIVEGETPGLVIDTLGINGARAATPLAWNADAWVEEVKAREPALIVLSYGTNEVGDVEAVNVYGVHYAALIDRLRAAAPDADCLIAGPTDRVRRDWITDPRVVAIDEAQRQIAGELGCAFFSTLDAMGGQGSLRRWAFGNPQYARRDRVHLLPRGYRKLGQTMADQLLVSYGTRYADPEIEQ
jgi:lysophospholipase L1-like esterase